MNFLKFPEIRGCGYQRQVRDRGGSETKNIRKQTLPDVFALPINMAPYADYGAENQGFHSLWEEELWQ